MATQIKKLSGSPETLAQKRQATTNESTSLCTRRNAAVSFGRETCGWPEVFSSLWRNKSQPPDSVRSAKSSTETHRFTREAVSPKPGPSEKCFVRGELRSLEGRA